MDPHFEECSPEREPRTCPRSCSKGRARLFPSKKLIKEAVTMYYARICKMWVYILCTQ